MVCKQSFLILSLSPELLLSLSELAEGGEGLLQVISILGEDWMFELNFPLQLHLVEDHVCLELEFTLRKLSRL